MIPPTDWNHKTLLRRFGDVPYGAFRDVYDPNVGLTRFSHRGFPIEVEVLDEVLLLRKWVRHPLVLGGMDDFELRVHDEVNTDDFGLPVTGSNESNDDGLLGLFGRDYPISTVLFAADL